MKLQIALISGCMFCSVCLPTATVVGQVQGEADARPFGQFLTIRSPISDAQVALLSNLAIELQSQAERDGREAVLVLTQLTLQ